VAALGESGRTYLTDRARACIWKRRGQSMHDGFPESATKTYVDLNRCGTPLIEFVSEPIWHPDERMSI